MGAERHAAHHRAALLIEEYKLWDATHAILSHLWCPLRVVDVEHGKVHPAFGVLLQVVAGRQQLATNFTPLSVELCTRALLQVAPTCGRLDHITVGTQTPLLVTCACRCRCASAMVGKRGAPATVGFPFCSAASKLTASFSNVLKLTPPLANLHHIMHFLTKTE